MTVSNNEGRNIQIMRLYFTGMSYGAIAAQMRMSRNAVAGVVHRSTFSNRKGQRQPFDDLHGQTFGRLLVIGRAENDLYGAAQFRCECECGTTKIIRGYHLRCGNTQSCGCLHKERVSAASRRRHNLRRFGCAA